MRTEKKSGDRPRGRLDALDALLSVARWLEAEASYLPPLRRKGMAARARQLFDALAVLEEAQEPEG